MCSTMCIQTPTFSPSTTHCFFRQPISSPFLSSSRKLYNVLRLNGGVNVQFSNGKKRGAIFSASVGQNSSNDTEGKRKVVEHICLLKAKENLSEEEEKDMLDYLYTTQYQMRGIIAITLGRISDQNIENYTHAVYMRFQRKEDLGKFYENPFYLGVLREHVMPYCHGLIHVDFESEVEDDILPIFRKGEEFNYGVEFILLISFVESKFGGPAEDALASLAELILEFPSLIVQSTQGLNFCPSSKEYTHGVVTRFRSIEALELFMGSTEYKDIWRSKFQMIIQKTLPIHFSVDPVGTEIM
ncbi:stress-response A/B barrel domain-containing protein UP3 isoform X1 [Vitis riparia]|uniref:stress-response A/B barrel domain-containing protein UP3 isoform X1 n=1 Tax=Vitis riparia TaxID=96939 RepID=UPI00155A82A7|nr:stress-response A/B barrel domain-containing protein UP3 isoform X1 [Vitis riparia]XP_034672491.1 stress-response A/B barrel domain-containing protein UP3 isoform X1 [Vitis riparia]XP_034672497.1 stress-response A/B barrel domain-containing protein UP3 isoform X1 [Vitis riparia]